jgi:single-strand DNA-binding protein
VEGWPTSWVRCAAWGTLGTHIAEGLHGGDRVIVHGNLRQRSYEHEGQRRTAWEVTVTNAGPSLKWVAAKVTQTESDSEHGDT